MKPQWGFIAAWLWFGAGCASRPEARLYVLTPPADGAAGSTPDRVRPRLLLQPVGVPDYLDTTDLLLRHGPHELTVSLSARWGERLSQGLTHALAAALAARLSPDIIDLDQGDEKAERQILVHVTALDLWPDGRCTLNAGWTVLEKDTRKVVVAAQAVVEIPAAGPGAVGDGALVAAMARAVGELADRVAADVKRPSISSLRPQIDRAGSLTDHLGVKTPPAPKI